MKNIALVLATVLLSSCAETPINPDLTVCPEARPQVCTMIFKPVCGELDTGERRTYASDCVACSHDNVVGYEDGECTDL